MRVDSKALAGAAPRRFDREDAYSASDWSVFAIVIFQAPYVDYTMITHKRTSVSFERLPQRKEG